MSNVITIGLLLLVAPCLPRLQRHQHATALADQPARLLLQFEPRLRVGPYRIDRDLVGARDVLASGQAVDRGAVDAQGLRQQRLPALATIEPVADRYQLSGGHGARSLFQGWCLCVPSLGLGTESSSMIASTIWS